MKNLSKILLFFSALLFFSCEEEVEGLLETPQGIIETSLSMFEGEVTESSQVNIEGVDAWKIQIHNPDASILNIFWQVRSSLLLKMEGIKAPYNYNINPGNNLINFSSARTIAKGQIQDFTLLRWSLSMTENTQNSWVYSFQFEDDNNIQIGIFVNASNGSILQMN